MSWKKCTKCETPIPGWGLCPACERNEQLTNDIADQEEATRELMAEEGRRLRDQIEENTQARIAASERASRATADSARALERAAYLENNPGDYQCPWCKMVSLKYEALCCPRCRRDVADFYWKEIRESKRLKIERVAEEKRVAELKRQIYLASPEYAKELERKALEEVQLRLASEAVVRKEARRKRLCAWKNILGAAFRIMFGILFLWNGYISLIFKNFNISNMMPFDVFGSVFGIWLLFSGIANLLRALKTLRGL
jgi:uncharacterized Zn finger protein (UPF0148 family)